MRMSQLFGATLRSAPKEAETPGHQLLLRGGFVRQLGQGIFSYLPLGWRVIQRIEAILREEMNSAGGAEISLPLVQPADVWRQSGRWSAVGPELTRFRDRRDRDMVLAMTHEEVVASLAASEIHSWRQLPRLIYQIQLKFRDDPRPRAGLIRTREFTMKDAYSLDRDQAGLDGQYDRIYRAYLNIFSRCGLPVIAVGADVGMMGGSEAHEFMYPTPIGEDTIVLCDRCGYAQNRQVATFAKPDPVAEELAPLDRVATPGANTIEALSTFLGIPAARTAKVVFVAATPTAGGRDVPVVAVVRGDMSLNETKLANTVGAAELRPMTGEEILAIGCVPGYASPIGVHDATVVVDEVIASSVNLVAGANQEGWHLRNVNLGRDYSGQVADIVAAEDGHPCVQCGAPLRTTRAVEVGNIFKLGTRYSEAFGANFLDTDGTERPVVMGSYGIGVGRLLACIAEERHDDAGLQWPAAVAPFDMHLCSIGEEGVAAAGELHDLLQLEGLTVLWDDRAERPGVQFADADLIGAPVRLTMSPRTLEANSVEVKRRDCRDAQVISRSDLLEHLRSQTDQGETRTTD
jgi:prolyl-tRNA synthetase